MTAKFAKASIEKLLTQEYKMDDLLDIMAYLRSDEGCPWDRVQTHYSIKRNMIEEAYEAVDAILAQDPLALKEELGDVLMQVVFHAQIAKENGEFSFEDITTAISHKLISRHTHIFADDIALDPDQVLSTWEKNKKIEKGHQNQTEVLEAVPKTFPALTRAYKVQKKAADVGFDWPDREGPEAKILEELAEIKEQIEEAREKIAANEWSSTEGQRAIEKEAGDLLFSVVNYLRFLKVEPEIALNLCTDRFIKRFALVEKAAKEKGQKLEQMTLEQLDKLWEIAKEMEETL